MLFGCAINTVRRWVAAPVFRQALEDGDVDRAWRMWKYMFPHMPQAQTYEQAEYDLHMARTAAESISLHKRLYSHAWLYERGIQSRLPDELRPKDQQRGKPIIVRAVGVAVGAREPNNHDNKAYAKEIERIMGEAGAEMILRGETDDKKISAYMWEKRRMYEQGRFKRPL